MKKKMGLFFVLVSSLLLGGTTGVAQELREPVLADNVEDLLAPEVTSRISAFQSVRSDLVYVPATEIEEIQYIQKEYARIKQNIQTSNKFATLPVLSNGQYSLGNFNQSIEQSAAEQINFYRTLAGVQKTPLVADSFEFTQHASIGMAAIKKQSHTLDVVAEKPADMPEAFWKTANEASRESNIHSAYKEASLNHHQDVFLVDWGTGNKSVGHRADILGLASVDIGFGYAWANEINPSVPSYFTSTYLKKDYKGISTRYEEEQVAHWPSKDFFPYELYNVENPYNTSYYKNSLPEKYEQNMRWSVHFNELGYEVPDQITATLTNLTTGKTEQMQNDSLGGELTVVRAKPGYYAQGGYATVVFRPNNQYIVNKNDLYKVEITGLKKAGQPYVHTYTTRFIGMNDEYKAEEIPISELKLSPKTAKLTVGKSQSLKAEISPETATNRTLSWSSNKPSVATVDEKGTVTGKTQGECVITVKDSTGKVSDSAVITVGNEETILVERVLPLYDYYKNIDINEEIFLNAIVYPKEASNQGYSFFVSEKDEPYVTIDPVKKTFKASKAGPYNVYVKSDDGNYVSQHVGFLMFNVGTGYYVEDNFFMYLGDPIKPEDRIRVESVSLPEKLTLSIDEGITLQPTIMPENASNKSCHFDSSDSSIVEVTHSEDGELVARKKGTATITVYTNNGALVATSEVTVK